MRIPIAVAMLALLAGCAGVAGGVRRPPLSEAEGEIQVYLDPLPAAARLALQVESVAAVAAGGAAAPLELLLPEVRPEPAARQPSFGRGAILLDVSDACDRCAVRLVDEGQHSDLL